MKEETIDIVKHEEEEVNSPVRDTSASESGSKTKKEILESNKNGEEKGEESPKVTTTGQLDSVNNNNCNEENFSDDEDPNDDERYPSKQTSNQVQLDSFAYFQFIFQVDNRFKEQEGFRRRLT